MSGRCAAICSIACWPSATVTTWIGSSGKRQRDHPLDSDVVVREQEGAHAPGYLSVSAATAVGQQAPRRSAGQSYPGPGVGGDEVDDVLHRRAGDEDALDAHRIQLRRCRRRE